MQESKAQANVIIYAHENDQDIGLTILQLIDLAKTLNISIVTYDPRGYGLSSSTPTDESTTYEDIEVALSFVLNKPSKSQDGLGYSMNKVILWGFGIGSGPAVNLASKYQTLLGLILEAPIASFYWMTNLEKGNATSAEEGSMYDSYNKMSNIRCSIMILHGRNDEIIPYKHSELLYERCLNDRMSFESTVDLILMENVGHYDVKKILNLRLPKSSFLIQKWLKRLESMETIFLTQSRQSTLDGPYINENIEFQQSIALQFIRVSYSGQDEEEKAKQLCLSQSQIETLPNQQIFEIEMQQFNVKKSNGRFSFKKSI